MNDASVITIGQQALVTALMIGAPILVVSMVVGMLVSIFQAMTQINEVTLSFIPKLLVLAAALYIGAGWMLKLMVGYSESLIKSIPSLIG